MNKVLYLAMFVFIFGVSGLSASGPRLGERPYIDIYKVPDEAIVRGRVRIKLNPKYSDLAERVDTQNSHSKSFGLTQLDVLNQYYGVRRIERVFSISAPGGRFHARHREWGFQLWFDLYLDSREDIRDIVMAYRGLTDFIAWAEPEYQKVLYDQPVSLSDLDPGDPPRWLPDDPRLPEQWHYQNLGQQGGLPDCDIDLPEAWELEKGLHSVIVAVIDQGIQTDHPDLGGNVWINAGEIPGNFVDDDTNGYIDDIYGYNFVTKRAILQAGDHGCHTSGTIAALTDNGLGVAGIAGGNGTGNGIRLMSCQVFNQSSNGGFAEALRYAADNGASIAQNSWGYVGPDYYDQAVLDAIDYFNQNGGGSSLQGGITIFAAGNGNSEGNWYPACYSGCFSVASTNNQDVRAYYSNYGSWVDVSAPGGETIYNINNGVLSTLANGSYGFLQGTSMACPHVSGTAALVVSYASRRNITLTSAQLADIIKGSTDDHYSANPAYIGKLGTGRINAYKALENALPGSPPQITWSPSSIYQELLAGQSATQTLTIGNLGFKPLSYTLSQPINLVTLLNESFTNTLPTGWTQQYQKGTVDWNFVTTGTHGVPRSPYEGTHFARFYSATPGVSTWLITPQLDLSEAVPGSATLTFWHFQQATTQGSFPYQDFLEVYCKYSNGTWVKLAEYLTEVRSWTQRVITLPNLSESYQIAFVATTARTSQTGYGVCVDAVQVAADVVEGIDWYKINGVSSIDGIVDGSLRDHDTITIEFSPGALDPGCYISLMRLSSNSQTNSYVEIPVTLDVGGTPLPVHLSSFTALIDGRNQVRLDWVTLAESGVMGFYILRCDTADLASALQVSPLIEATNTSQTQSYSYTDSETLPGSVYYYWLQCLDMDGGLVYHGPIRVTTGADVTSTPGVPLVSLLEPAYPNPFNIETSIAYCLDRPGTARIDILNARGQLVRSIALEHAEAGRFCLLFDGRDERGIDLASGIYHYRLSSGGFCQTRRMILLK